MDYLDPKKKRSHAIRLYIGYGLMTVAIAIATVILVYVGSGYDVDRSTGDLIQNGQLFVNSDPDGATISLNGRLQRTKTAGRLVVPSGNYEVVVSRDGYRDWKQTVQLDGGLIQSLDYIRLLPKTINSDVMQTFANSPLFVSQSIDRRYLAFIFDDKPSSIFIYDTAKPDQSLSEIALPKTVFGNPDKIAKMRIIEWSDDDKHFLIENSPDGVDKEYITASRETSEQPVNVTIALGLVGQNISMRDRSHDSFYVYNPADKSLSTVSINNKTPQKKLDEVIAYKTFGTDTVLYVTARNATTGKVQARLLSDDKTHLLRDLTQAPSYLLDMAKLGGSVVIAVGSPLENKVTVLRNPVAYLRLHPNQTYPMATTVLQVEQPSEVSFSTDATTVIARGGQKAASHHFVEDRTKKFSITQPLGADKLRWVDGKHITFVSNGQAYMADYDGANTQAVVPSLQPFGMFFDNNYQSVYGFTAGNGGKPFNITRSSLRAAQ